MLSHVCLRRSRRPRPMTWPVGVSFAACGFLGVYHLGAAMALRAHGAGLLRDVTAFAGASAGALVAAALLTAPGSLEVTHT